VLCAHANRNSLLGYLLCKRHGALNLIIRCHGACVLEFAERRPALVQFLLSRAHAVNCVSRYIADIAVQRGARSDRTSVILSARDVSQAIDVAQKKNRVLFCANLKKHKDPLTFVRAAETCCAEYPDLRDIEFHLIGDGALRPGIEAYIDAHNLRPKISVRGSLAFQQVWQLMRDSKILVLSSTREPSGAVLTEAMALGCYCIATRVGGVPEIVTPDRGSLFEPGDFRMLARLIADYFRHEETYMSRVAAAYRYVKDTYSFERAANMLEESFNE
jgi:glycosyltransferase involved in cell wall biosynthesis